jgi:hypothetical protein
MQVNYLNPSHPQWMETLEELSYDFYHLPGYLNLEANRIQATPEAVVIQDGEKVFFLPYLLRPWYGDSGETLGLDVVSPYGYPGFLLNSASKGSSEFLCKAITQLQQAWQTRKICSAFLRLHPLLNIEVEQSLAEHPALQTNGETLSINLNFTLEELWRQTRENHRRSIRQLKRLGFSVEVVPVAANLDSFIAIYEETMDRVNAKPLYYFSQDYFLQLIHTLGSQIHLCVVRFDQSITAAALITECNGIVQYHLGGTLNRFLKDSPIKLTFDYIRVWAKERGNHLFHLGGGLGAAKDSLYHFKAGFANQVHPFHTLRLIVNQPQYSSWTTMKAQQLNQTPEQLQSNSFFPAYRVSV